MNSWLDAHLSPILATWIFENIGVSAQAVRDLGLRDAKDPVIFQAARKANAILLTKDSDFLHLLAQHGPPPRVLLLTCGNTSNQNLQQILRTALPTALRLLNSGEALVEITGKAPGSSDRG